MKKVSEVMTRDVRLVGPDDTIRQAASIMVDSDIGSLPVAGNDRLIGMITDRDIVLRAVAQGLDAQTPVRAVMTDKIQYCFEDEDVTQVAEHMSGLGVRRLPVLSREKRLVGIISLSNVAHDGNDKATNKLLKGVAVPH